MIAKQRKEKSDIQSRKIAFVQDFLNIDNEGVIEQFEELMKQFTVPMSVSELNRRIDRSENDFKSGRFKTSSELLAKYK
ncbi:MAG: hypothetical protein GX371_11900 [Bacteroidales bacterium]|jgi:hypothetical protein|nr:hypothetical protein [Bacteroidales bacterium]